MGCRRPGMFAFANDGKRIKNIKLSIKINLFKGSLIFCLAQHRVFICEGWYKTCINKANRSLRRADMPRVFCLCFLLINSQSYSCYIVNVVSHCPLYLSIQWNVCKRAFHINSRHKGWIKTINLVFFLWGGIFLISQMKLTYYISQLPAFATFDN